MKKRFQSSCWGHLISCAFINSQGHPLGLAEMKNGVYIGPKVHFLSHIHMCLLQLINNKHQYDD